jgi:transposase
LAPRLLVAFGTQRDRFPLAANLQRLSGIAPVTEKSGNRQWVHWRWSAPRFLRQSFVEWANQSIRYSAWAAADYAQQQNHGKRHQAILRALAFKWIRILWKCWRDNVPYDEARYLKHLATKNSSLVKVAYAK